MEVGCIHQFGQIDTCCIRLSKRASERIGLETSNETRTRAGGLTYFTGSMIAPIVLFFEALAGVTRCFLHSPPPADMGSKVASKKVSSTTKALGSLRKHCQTRIVRD